MTIALLALAWPKAVVPTLLWNAHLDHRYPDDVFPILENVFFDVDAYCGDDRIRGEGDLDADQLRASAGKALEQLRGLE